MPRKTIDDQAYDFIESLGILIRRARAAADPHGLSLSESAVLGRLAQCGPSTSAELARAASMRPQSMGSTIAALEHAGLVVRTPHATDGRRMLIALTPKGAALRTRMRAAKQAWLLQAIARLSKREQQTLFAGADILRRLAGNDPS